MLRLKTDEEILVQLGLAIRAERARRQWRQSDLAREAGLAERTVHRIEVGEPVGTDNLLRVMRPLGLLDRLGAVIEPSLQETLSPLDDDDDDEPTVPRRVRPSGPRMR